MFKNYSYRTKMLLWIMPVLITGLLLLSGSAYWYAKQVVEKELTDSMLATTAKAAEGINIWCKTLVLEPETVAATPSAKLINVDFTQIDQLNTSRRELLHRRYPDLFRDIYAANRWGIYHTVQVKDNQNSFFVGDISNREYFKSIMNGRPAQITPPLVSRTTNEPTIFVVAPINGENGVPQGLIGAGISLAYVQNIAESLKASPNGYGVLIAQDGTFIYHPNQDYIMKKKISDMEEPSVRELGQLMMGGNSGVQRYRYNEQEKIAFYYPIPFTGWSVATVLPVAEFFAPATMMLQRLMLLTVSIIILMVFVIWWSAKRFAQPLQELAAYAMEIGNGNMQAQPPAVQAEDEVGRLAKIFHEMIKNLACMMAALRQKNQDLEMETGERRKAQDALRQINDELEQTVEARTQELYAANQELTAMNQQMQAINETLHGTNIELQNEITYRCQMQEQLVAREKQYQAIATLLTGPVDHMPSFLVSVLEQALAWIKAADGYISLYNEKEQRFVLQHGIGIHTEWQWQALPGEQALQEKVYQTGDMLFVDDCLHSTWREQYPLLEKVSSMILLPLRYGGEVKGILAASWRQEVPKLTADDIALLRQYGDLAAVAIERLSVQQEMRQMAFYDKLTGLPNRLLLTMELEKALKKRRNVVASGVLFLIDIDDLKTINDNFGHVNGDTVILAISEKIVASVGQRGFVARQGGDEFIVWMRGEVTREAAELLAAEILHAVSQEYQVVEERVYMSASIGIVLYPVDDVTVEGILKKADSAMYAAKAAGRNRWQFYDSRLTEAARQHMLLTNGLRRALERGEFYLHYQPQLDIASGEITGYEALLRWHSAEHGLVSPLQFIPVAEHSGLIQAIGRWVLAEACRFARKLAEQGRGQVKVAVNVSARQFVAGGFVEDVMDAIHRAQVLPQQIEIEVTESIMIDRVEESCQALARLRDFGVGVALDDFGTGYSSLTYLRSLPVKVLKIDKSFIDKICVDSVQLELVGSIIQMGHNLGLSVVAEGVETMEQLELLKTLQCDSIQGYVFSRPLPEQEAREFQKKL